MDGIKRVTSFTTVQWDCPHCEELNEVEAGTGSRLEKGKYIAVCCCWQCNKNTEVEEYGC
jgi:transcription elongation factor Elf1